MEIKVSSLNYCLGLFSPKEGRPQKNILRRYVHRASPKSAIQSLRNQFLRVRIVRITKAFFQPAKRRQPFDCLPCEPP